METGVISSVPALRHAAADPPHRRRNTARFWIAKWYILVRSIDAPKVEVQFYGDMNKRTYT